MGMMHRIRNRSSRLAKFSAGLFVLVWISLVAAPCAIAMELGQMPDHHDCPHCPPAPCHEMQPQDCQAPDSLDSPRLSDKNPSFDSVESRAANAPAARLSRSNHAPLSRAGGLPRAGPRVHLLQVRFKE